VTKQPHTWRIRVAFEPNRFSPEQLVNVYEKLQPTAAQEAQTKPQGQPAKIKRSAMKRGVNHE
jgi:hypothetical protein